MVADNYTSYAYEEGSDLVGAAYWIYVATDTPPGHPRTPMFDWMFMNLSNWGSGYTCDKLCMPDTKGVAFRSYHGYKLMTVVLPTSDEEVLKRTEVYKPAIRRLIENYDQLWAEAKARLMGYTEKPEKVDFDKASWFELAELLSERIDAEREMYKIHQYFAEGLGLISAHFERICSKLLGVSESDPLFQDLLSGLDNDSYEVDRGFHRLSVRADELGVGDILLQNKPEEVISGMSKGEAGRQWVKELGDFLHIHGWRCHLDMEYMSPSWFEKPALPIRDIQQYLEKGGVFELDEILSKKARQRSKAEAELISKVPAGQREWFKVFIKMAQNFQVWKGEHTYYCEMYQYAMTRYVLMGIGERLSGAGCIEKAEDIFFLIPEEIYKVLLSDPEVYRLNATVKMRKEVWEENKKITPPPLMAKVSQEVVSRLILKSKDPLAMKLLTGKVIADHPEQRADFVGDVASRGIAEGPARVLSSEEQLGELQKGEILVVPALWPSVNSVLPLVKGVVSDSGSVLLGASGVAREYGIPVVSNVIDGTSKIRTGQRLRVDGNLGTVDIVGSIEGKRILIVDDEPDILEILKELLAMCDVSTAGNFDEGEKLLKTQDFDVAILDIMGVDGYKLLEIAQGRNVVAVMLTAHALSLEDTAKSFRKGAAHYIPKDELGDIAVFLNDVLESKGKGRRFWRRWYDRFGAFYEKRFGSGWQNRYEEFWEIFQDEDPLSQWKE